MFGAKQVGLMATAALAAGLAFATPAPAVASNHASYGEGGDPGPRQRGIHRWMGRDQLYERPRYYGRRGYYRDNYRYGYRYGRPYRPYRHYYYGNGGWDPGAAAAAGIIGLTTGAILGNALANQGGADRSCYRFRTYNPRTGTYIGYDGRRHYCP